MLKGHWIEVLGFECWVDLDVIIVRNAFLLAYDDIARFCVALRSQVPFVYLRSNQSWIEELVAHAVLYNRGLFRNQSRDADINEDESLFRLISYKVIYWLNKLFRWYW